MKNTIPMTLALLAFLLLSVALLHAEDGKPVSYEQKVAQRIGEVLKPVHFEPSDLAAVRLVYADQKALLLLFKNENVEEANRLVLSVCAADRMTTYAGRPVPKNRCEALLRIRLHTQVSGGISRNDFDQWTRWYQEDGNTQVFRLFKGEQNVRGGTGNDGSPGRVEAFSHTLTIAPGTWREWEGTYTFIQPVRGCIFQLMHEGSLWPFHIEMSGKGDISFLRRRPVPGMERAIVMAENMVGKSLSVKVRANGEDYEVYQKAPLDAGPWKLVTKGSFTMAKDNKISFRWGMYCGSKKGHAVSNDALLFVTGATIR